MTFKPTWALGLMLILAAVSCGKDDPATGGSGALSVQASLPSGSLKAGWTAADQVRCFITADGKQTTVTLSSSGAGTVTTLTTDKAAAGSEYRFFYPANKAILGLPSAVFGSIPSRQTAVVGGVADDAFIAVAYTGDPKQTVTFQPVTSYLKFSLSGAGAAAVDRIEFTATNGEILVGDIRVVGMEGASMTVHSDGSRGKVTPTSTVVLSGPFSAGADYYVSVLPGTVGGIDLSLVDAEGRAQNYTVSRSVDLERGRAADLGAVPVGAFTGSSDFAPRFRFTRSGIKPIVFVFMADGFTESERETYTAAAQASIDHIFSVQPYKGLKEYFSAYVCWTPSTASGLGARWGTTASSASMMQTYGQDGRNKIYDYVAERCPEVLEGATPLDNVGIFMLCNADKYIRPVCDWETSGRFVTPVGIKPNTSSGYSRWCFGGSWKNYEFRDGVRHDMTAEELTALGYTSSGTRQGDYRDECLHEGAGHGFGRLMDEYWTEGSRPSASTPSGIQYYYNMTFPTGLNVSASATDAPWKHLDALRDELVAKDARYAKIGTYEGAYGYETGVWRAEQVTAMMDNRPYFSTWQRALIYQRLMRSSGEDIAFNAGKTEDLKRYLDLDLQFEGAYDRLRDQ